MDRGILMRHQKPRRHARETFHLFWASSRLCLGCRDPCTHQWNVFLIIVYKWTEKDHQLPPWITCEDRGILMRHQKPHTQERGAVIRGVFATPSRMPRSSHLPTKCVVHSVYKRTEKKQSPLWITCEDRGILVRHQKPHTQASGAIFRGVFAAPSRMRSSILPTKCTPA